MHKALIAGMAAALISSTAMAADYHNPDAPPVETPFSFAAPNTYDGYPLFRSSSESGNFRYAANGIYVHGEMSRWSNLVTYTVEDNNDGTIVTRESKPTSSGYRMVRGTHNESLFVLGFRS